ALSDLISQAEAASIAPLSDVVQATMEELCFLGRRRPTPWKIYPDTASTISEAITEGSQPAFWRFTAISDESKPGHGSHTVKVFGSTIVQVAPDTASIAVAVSRLEQKPEAAFSNARKGAQAVSCYLQKARMTDFGSSRITLSQEIRYTSGESRFASYQA